MDWHLKNLHFETSQHKALESETFVKNMENLKQKDYLDGTRWPRCPKPLFVRAKVFIKVATKGYAFLIYVFPSPHDEPHPHKILSQY